MTREQEKLINAAQSVVDVLNTLNFSEVIVVFSAVSDAVTGGNTREASIAKTKMEEAVLWMQRAASVKAAQEATAQEIVTSVSKKKRPRKKSS